MGQVNKNKSYHYFKVLDEEIFSPDRGKCLTNEALHQALMTLQNAVKKVSYEELHNLIQIRIEKINQLLRSGKVRGRAFDRLEFAHHHLIGLKIALIDQAQRECLEETADEVFPQNFSL